MTIKEKILDIDDYATAIKKVEDGIYMFKDRDKRIQFYSQSLDCAFDSIEFLKKEQKRVYNEDSKYWLATNGDSVEVVKAETLDIAKQQKPKANTFQLMEKYRLYKYDDKTVIKHLHFGFFNGKLVVLNDHGTTILKIEECNEYTYKFLKTKVKAKNGYAGLIAFIMDVCKDLDSPHNRTFYNVLNKIGA